MRVSPWCFVVLTCLAPAIAPAADTPPPAADKAEGAADAALKKPVPDAAFNDVQLRDVVDFLADVTSVNLYLDRAALESAGVDIAKTQINGKTAPNTPLEAVLKDVVAQIRTKEQPGAFAACGDVVVISTKQGAKDFVERHRKAIARTKLAGADVLGKALPEIPLQGINLSDVIDFLRDVTAANIVVDWKKLEAVGVTRTTPITLRAREIKLAQVLQLLLDEAWPTKAIGFELKDGTITISTAPGEKDPPPHPKDKPAAAGKQGL